MSARANKRALKSMQKRFCKSTERSIAYSHLLCSKAIQTRGEANAYMHNHYHYIETSVLCRAEMFPASFIVLQKVEFSLYDDLLGMIGDYFFTKSKGHLAASVNVHL